MVTWSNGLSGYHILLPRSNPREKEIESKQPAAPITEEQKMQLETDILADETIDDLCYELALALRRILDLEEEDYDEETGDS